MKGTMVPSSSRVVLATLVGWTLGGVRNGREDFVRVSGYEPIPRQMSPGEPFDAWCAWHKHWSKGLPPETLGTTAKRHLRLNEEDSQYGWINLARGLGSPASGRLDNPLAACSSAMTRALYWGIVCQGDPDLAARYAFYDASLDHADEGAWIPTAFAVALAKTKLGDDPQTVVQNVLSALPKRSLLTKAGILIAKSVGNPEGPRELRRGLPEALALRDPEHAVLTGAWALLGIAHSGGDPGKAALVAAGCGGAAGHAAASAATLASAAFGDLHDDWTAPLGDRYVSANATRYLEPPATIAEFMALIPPPPVTLPPGQTSDEVVLESAAGDTPEAADPEPEPGLAVPAVQASTWQTIESAGLATTSLAKGALVTTTFVDGLVATKTAPIRLQIGVKNPGDKMKEFDLKLRCPGGKLATRVATTALSPGGERLFPAVYEPDLDSESGLDLTLSVNGAEVEIVVPRPFVWMTAGPFENIEGTGYDSVFAPERGQQAGQPFSGRSGIGFTWTPMSVSGPVIHVEPLFKGGPGTVYLFTTFSLPAGAYTVMGSIGTGLKLWIDGALVVSYHDHTDVVHRPAGRNHAQFQTSGTVTVLAKIVRGLNPCPDLVVAFQNEDGSVCLPDRTLPMG